MFSSRPPLRFRIHKPWNEPGFANWYVVGNRPDWSGDDETWAHFETHEECIRFVDWALKEHVQHNPPNPILVAFRKQLRDEVGYGSDVSTDILVGYVYAWVTSTWDSVMYDLDEWAHAARVFRRFLNIAASSKVGDHA